MHYEPTLRLRKGRRPRILGNVLTMAICLIWVFTFVAWGVTPGPSKDPRPSVTVPPHTPLCPDPTVLSDPNC